MVTLGISSYYHDSSACLIKDGVILAAASEERFTRIKHDNNFPKNAIDFCLRFSGKAINEVDHIVFYEKPILKFGRILDQHISEFPQSLKSFVNSMGSWFSQKMKIQETLRREFGYTKNVLFVPHHLSHAAASYVMSGFDKAVIVTLDGVGEWASTAYGFGESGMINMAKEIRFPHSLGLMYSAFTAYLGFKVNSAEYKVMGLAAYGDPIRFKSKMDKVVKIFSDGSYSLNMDLFDFTWADHMPGKNLAKLFGFPPRTPESKVETQYADIAASLQMKLEETIFNLLTVLHKKYKSNNLCLSGGVALNSVMNGKITKNTPFKNIYIHPDPGDAGGALGAAILINNTYSKVKVDGKKFTPYLGPGFEWFQIKSKLDKYGLKYKLYDSERKFLSKVVDILTAKKVVGWFQGRMEWGPRALGARSILAAANDEQMKSILNEKVKKRETFRPFAPVILGKYVDKYFYTKDQPMNLAKYMLLVLPFKPLGKKEAAATVHVDGTGRLQSIERRDNPLYYNLIAAFMKKTGSPMLVNTSFNIRGEPIVCKPEDAIKCFLGTGIDALVIDRYIIEK